MLERYFWSPDYSTNVHQMQNHMLALTWSKLTAVTVEPDSSPMLKDKRQTPEDTSHTRTVYKKST